VISILNQLKPHEEKVEEAEIITETPTAVLHRNPGHVILEEEEDTISMVSEDESGLLPTIPRGKENS
jgi:hypothetical protein